MKYVEETYARELHGQLSQGSGAKPIKTVSISGAGVHWDVIAENGARLCKIHCFGLTGPEYLISFRQAAEELAMGRTLSREGAIAATVFWLEGNELSDLHAGFQFVDGQKRALENIQTKVFAYCPELEQSAVAELQHKVCDLYELWFRADGRSCRIYYYGKNEFPDAIFNWDECRIFAVQTGDFEQIALLLKRWLGDHVMPSAIRKEFPSIEIGTIGRYYEEGRGVEGEFVESWDRIERFYAEMKFPPAEAIRSLVKAIREKGYDHTLRAGQSLYTLVLSRSRRHGLRNDQPNLAFHFRQDGMDVSAKNLEAKSISASDVSLTDDIEGLLERLAQAGID